MNRRRLVILMSIPVFGLGLAMLFASWVLNTENGAHWLLARATNSIDGQLSTGQVSGNLADGLVMTDLRFKEEGMELVATNLKTVIRLSLVPLQVKVVSLQAQGLEIRVAGGDTLSFPGAAAQGQVALSSPYEQHWTGHGNMLDPLATANFEFSFKGIPSDYDLGLKALVTSAGLPTFELTLQGQGDLEELRVGGLSVDSTMMHSIATGVVAWADFMSIDLDVDVEHFEPAPWVSAWPIDQFVYGRFALHIEDSSIDIQRLNAKVAGSGVILEGEGKLDLQSEKLDARFSWHRFTWPVAADEFELASDKGQLHVSGSPANWRLEGSLELELPDYPGGSFDLAGSGGVASAEITIVEGEVLGGTVAGQVSLDWADALLWKALLEVKQLDTSALMADWPARLDAKFELSQNMGDDSFNIQFESLHGELEGRSLDGSGGITVNQTAVRFKGLRLHEGSSRILLDGDLGDPAGLKFSIDINRPGWMADYLGVEVNGQGHIALQAPKPVLDVELRANDFVWDDVRIENIHITPVAGNDAEGLALKIMASNIEFGGFSLPAVDATIAGDKDRQKLDLRFNFAEHELVTMFDGSLSDWKVLADAAWSGQLTKLALTSGQQTLLSLQNPAPLTVSVAGFSLGKACVQIVGSNGLCLESEWQTSGQFDLAAKLSKLPLNVLQLMYPEQIVFTQTLDGEINWTHRPGKYPSGSAAISISSGQFGDAQNEHDHVSTAEGFFGFQLVDGNLTAGEFDIPFPDIGQIDLDYAISGMAMDGTGKVDGKISIDLNDLSVLEPLLPGLEKVGGQMNIDLRVSGSVLDPALDGSVGLTNGTADVAWLGTQLRQVRLEGLVNSGDRAVIEGDFKAGDGQGDIALEVEFADWSAPAVQVAFSGSSLRLLNTPELRMNADTDIRLGWGQGEWSIDGAVVVQNARIAPVTFVISKVTESEDVQLVSGTLPYGGAEQVISPAKVTGSLDVSLGDNVRIDTELAKAKLSGSVSLKWEGEVIPVATGSIHADGTLSVFGPKLHVKDGQLRFPGVPLTDPILDIRAERDVFGNTQIRTAGVSITGPARRPVIEAFTNPLTTTDRAWALLITGSDVDYGQGVGAFEVGTYIAPRLYLSYGISLFDDDNVISARYDLKKGFGVKASSGQRESGIDMSYTIDR